MVFAYLYIYWYLYDIFYRKKVPFQNIGLYRDGGLAIFKNVRGSDSEKIKKHLQSLFKKKGLQINYRVKPESRKLLDVTFILNDCSHWPYHHQKILSDTILEATSRQLCKKQKNLLINGKKKMMETLGKFENAILYCLTHLTANH